MYGLLSAALTAVYAGIVVGIGTLAGYAGGPVLTIAAAVTIAVLFQPVRQRAQLVANRLVYGQRATPYQVLADFAEDMAGQLDVDVGLDRMASVLAGATGAVRVEIWIRVGAQLRPPVTWPRGSTPPAAVPLTSDAQLPAFGAATRAIAVRHTDELLGAITIEKPRNEPVSAAEDRLLEHLASQAGLVLRNVRLTAELQATHRRLEGVAAAAGQGPGRGAAADRAQPARRCPAAARRAHGPAHPAGRLRQRPRRGQADGRPAPGRAARGAR